MAGKVMAIEFEGKTFKANRTFLDMKASEWIAGGERFVQLGKVPEVYIDLVEFCLMKNPNRKEIVKALRC